jgi:hypothetical protein
MFGYPLTVVPRYVFAALFHSCWSVVPWILFNPMFVMPPVTISKPVAMAITSNS